MFSYGFPRHWSTLRKLLWLKLLQGAAAVVETVTGTLPLTLANAMTHAIVSLTRYGLCTQDGTPTPDAPVDIMCNNGALKYSANMADVNEQTALVGYYISQSGAVTADSYNWMYQSFIPCKPNTTYTLSMSQSVYFVSISEYSTADDSGFIVRKAGSTGSNTSLTITTGATTNYIRFGTNLDRTTVTLEEVLAINWMLNIGGTAMNYQPYVEGGIYTDGTPEVLTVSGINLLDPATSNITIGQQVTANGEITSLYPNNWRTDYIPVEGGKTYAFWGRTKSDNTISAYNRINWYTVDKTHIPPRPSYTVDTVTVGTAPSNAAYAMLSCSPYKSNAAITREAFDLFNWMFAEAAQEIPYEPYVTPQTASVPMLLSVGDYKDEGEIISGGVTHRVGIKVFDGTESWTKGTIPSSNYYYGGDTILNGNTEKELMCNQFAVGARNVPSIGKICAARNARNGFLIAPVDQTIDTEAKFKAWLAAQYAAGTPVIVIYPLATETTEQTTANHLVTHKGTNIVDSTANVGPLEAKVEYMKTA